MPDWLSIRAATSVGHSHSTRSAMLQIPALHNRRPRYTAHQAPSAAAQAKRFAGSGTTSAPSEGGHTRRPASLLNLGQKFRESRWAQSPNLTSEAAMHASDQSFSTEAHRSGIQTARLEGVPTETSMRTESSADLKSPTGQPSSHSDRTQALGARAAIRADLLAMDAAILAWLADSGRVRAEVCAAGVALGACSLVWVLYFTAT